MAVPKAKKRKESPAPPTQQQQQQQQQESSPELPKRTKVQAQRKFAQGQSAPSSAGSHSALLNASAASAAAASSSSGGVGAGGAAGQAGGASSSGPDSRDKPTELLPNKRPKTDDFLTFLCFRSTPNLPPHLDFLKQDQQKSTTNNTKEATTTATAAGASAATSVSASTGRSTAAGAKTTKKAAAATAPMTKGKGKKGKKGRPKGSGKGGAKAKAPHTTSKASGHDTTKNSTEQAASPPATPSADNNVIAFAVRKRAEVVPDGNRRSRAIKRHLRSTADTNEKGASSPETKQQRRSNRGKAVATQPIDADDHDDDDDGEDEDEEEDDEDGDAEEAGCKQASTAAKAMDSEEDEEEEFFSANDDLDGGGGKEAAHQSANAKKGAAPKSTAKTPVSGKKAAAAAKGKATANGNAAATTKRDADSMASEDSNKTAAHKQQESPKPAKAVETPLAKDKPAPVKRPRQKESPIFIPSTETSGRMTRQRAFFEPVKVIPQVESESPLTDEEDGKKKKKESAVAKEKKEPTPETTKKSTATSNVDGPGMGGHKRKSAVGDRAPASAKGESAATPTPATKDDGPRKSDAAKKKDESSPSTSTDVFEFSSDDEQPLAKSMNLKKGKSNPKKSTPPPLSAAKGGKGAGVAKKLTTAGHAPKKAPGTGPPTDKAKRDDEPANGRTQEQDAEEEDNDDDEDDVKVTKANTRRVKKGTPAVEDGAEEEEDGGKKGAANSTRQSRKKSAKTAMANGDERDESPQAAPVRSPRPTRKTKEAAAIYMGIIGHKLQLAEDEDDDLSLNSYPDLPNVKEMEKLESELKRNAAAAKEGGAPGGELKSSPSTIAAEEKPTTSARRGRPPKQKQAETKATPTSTATTAKGSAKSNGEAKKTPAGTPSIEADERKGSGVKEQEDVMSEDMDNDDDEEDFLLNEEVNETKRKLEKSFSDSDDEPLAIKVSVKNSEKENGVAGALAVEPKSQPASVATPTAAMVAVSAASKVGPATQSAPNVATPTATTAATQVASHGVPGAQVPPTQQQQLQHHHHHHGGVPQHHYHPIGGTSHPPSPFKTTDKKSPVPTSKILNVPATYAMPSTNPMPVPMPMPIAMPMPMQMPMPMGMQMGPLGPMVGGPPQPPPPNMQHTGQAQGQNFQKPAAYMPQGPPHYHGQPHGPVRQQQPPCLQFSPGKVGPGAGSQGPAMMAQQAPPNAGPLQMPQGPIKYQQAPPKYVPPMEAYPSPKINPNFLTPKFDRTTIPRQGNFPAPAPMRYDMTSVPQPQSAMPTTSGNTKISPPTPQQGAANQASTSSARQNQMMAQQPSQQQPPAAGVSPTAQLMSQAPLPVAGAMQQMVAHHMQQHHQQQQQLSAAPGPSGSQAAATGAAANAEAPAQQAPPNTSTTTTSNNNNNNNTNNNNGTGGGDALADEIGSILAANLMPSKEESGKIFGIASVSLAQSSGPDNTKCTLGKCGSIHKPVLGPVVPTESYIGDQLSGKERRKAKVNMTHEQIQKWLIECSSEPDEIHDDLADDEIDESQRPLLITPPPTRDDKESTSLSSSSARVTRSGEGVAKCEIAWTAKGPALKSSVATGSANAAPKTPGDGPNTSTQPADSTVCDGGGTSAAPAAADIEIISLVDNATEGTAKQQADEKERPSPANRKANALASSSSKQTNSRAAAAAATTGKSANAHNNSASSAAAGSASTSRQNKSLKASAASTPTLLKGDGESSTQDSNSQKQTPGKTTGGASSKRTPVYNQKSQRSAVDLKETTTTSHKKSTAVSYGAFSADNEKSVYSFDKDDGGAAAAGDAAKAKATNFRRQSRREAHAPPDEVPLTPTTTTKGAVAEKRSSTGPGEKASPLSSSSPPSPTDAESRPNKQAKFEADDKSCLPSTSKAAAAANSSGANSRASAAAKKRAGAGKTQGAREGSVDSEDQTFYIPLSDAGAGAGGKGAANMQVIAVKCGKEGPDGPNQKVVVHTSLISKSEMVANCKPLPDSMNVTEIVKSMMSTSATPDEGTKKKAPTPAKSSTTTSTAASNAKNLQSPRPTGAGGSLVRVNSNSSLVSPKAKGPAVGGGGSVAGGTAGKKFKDDKPPIKMANNTAFPRHDDPTQMVDAPIFRPTDKEFADPIEFIERITPIAARFGICKIIPPPTFKPECRISDEMRFTAQNQYVHKMLHRWGPSAKELSAIKKYLATQSIVMNHPPWIGGMEVDLPRLYHTVQEMGGLKEVIEKKKWARVAEDMSIPKLAQDRVTKLDDIYCKYLLPYDTLSPAERQKLFDEVEADWAKREARARRNADRFVNTESVSNEEDDMSSEDEEESEEEVDGVSMECIVKGRSMPLSQFYRIARNTKALWFKNTDPIATEVEAEFWRHVAVRDSHVCVHAGSIDSSGWGYGFPSPGPKGKGSNYARHPWNLKVLTNNPGSVLRSLGPVMGVTVPTLHVGMLFSACCWYRDPHGLSWIEYLHTGASKLWYGIPDDQSANFRAALTALIPTHCQNKTIWLPCDTVMVPPHMLTDRGVSLCRIEQKPGEFIVVFPRAYTSSVSTGYVVSESVYFATNSWLELAKEDFRDIHDSSEPAMFSLEQLLFALGYDQRVTTETLMQMQPMLHDVFEKESAAREQLKAAGVTSAEKTISEKGARLKKQQPPFKSMESECELCSANLYISMVKTDDGNVYCLQHALKNLNKGNIQAKHCKLIYAYKVEDIENLMRTLKEKVQQKKNAATTGKKSK